MTRHTGDGTRAAILDAARRLLVVEGPDGLTVRRIAGAAGHSTMAVYSRFGGKDGIVDELFAEGFRRLTHELHTAGVSDAPITDLARQLQAYRRFAAAHPQHYALMFQRPVPGFEPTDATKATALGALGVLADALRRAMDAGALAPADPFDTAVTVWGTAHGLVSIELAGAAPPGVDWDVVHDRTWTALLTGLGATGQGWGAPSPLP